MSAMKNRSYAFALQNAYKNLENVHFLKKGTECLKLNSRIMSAILSQQFISKYLADDFVETN